MNTLKLLEAGRVRRYHNAPHIEDKQQLSEHSWQVAVFLLDIYPQASVHLVTHALVHDCGELFTGDMPAPYKLFNYKAAEQVKHDEANYMGEVLGIPPLSFTEEETRALKFADILSGLYHAAYEVVGGNRHAIRVFDEFCSLAQQQPYFNHRSVELYEEIKSYVS